MKNNNAKTTKTMSTPKKIFAAASIMALALCSMAGCGAGGSGTGNAGSGNEGTQTDSTAKTYKVGIVQYVDDASLNQIEKAIEAQLDAKGAEL